MNVLIFEWSVQGHHLEYLHHIYTEACRHPEHRFLFYVPAEFAGVKDKFSWEPAENIDIQFLTDKESLQCNKENLLASAFLKSLIIRRIVRKYHIDRVWLIMFMHLMPFLPFLLPRKVLVSGILYRIYFYEGSSIRGARLLLEKLRYTIFAGKANVEAVYVLNDDYAAGKLNSLYHSSKFISIPDPVPMIDDSQVRSIRQEIGVSESDTMFLHFGGLDKRKGTLDILEAIGMMSAEELKDDVFVFAGKIKDGLKADFYFALPEAEKKARILVFDEFCSYQRLNDLCFSSDVILIPYKNPNQSSGVIGYASHFAKPVIGPSAGLLGRLIKEYRLGAAIDDMSPSSLADALCSCKTHMMQSSTRYAECHSVCDFNRTIFQSISGI